MSAKTPRAAAPARGIVQCSKNPKGRMGSKREGVADEVLQGMHAPERVRLPGRCASGCSGRGPEGGPSYRIYRSMPHTYILYSLIPMCKDRRRHARLRETVQMQHPSSTSVSTANRNTFHEGMSPNRFSVVVGQPSCKRFVLRLLLPLLLLQETRWLDGQAAQTLTPALREGWETWWVDGDGNCFWRALSLSIWRSQRFYRQVKLVVLAYAAGNSETLVSKGRHLHDNITYYDASVVQKFIGAERAAQHERMLLAELAPLCANRGWAGRITAYLASEALGCTVKFIHPVDKKARVKQDAGAVTRGREKKSLTFGDNRWSRTYVPTGPHTALRVRGVGGKQDTFVEEATVTFTKHVVERRVSTQSELEALNIAAVEGDTDVEGLCHFAAILPKDGNARPFPVHEAAPPLYMSKVRVGVCLRVIAGSSVPPTMTVTSLQQHCCCPLVLDGFDFALKIALVFFPLPG